MNIGEIKWIVGENDVRFIAIFDELKKDGLVWLPYIFLGNKGDSFTVIK